MSAVEPGTRALIEVIEHLADYLRDWRLAPCDHTIDMDQEPCCSPCLRDRIAAAGLLRVPEVVETAEELNALPRGTVVRSSAGTIACRFDQHRGVVFGDDRPFGWQDLALPATVLHRGGVA